MLAAALAAALSSPAFAQQTLVERLGYPAGAKLIIVHADDLGMAHSVNAASIKAFETRLVSSGSIMAGCPWFPEIAAWARTQPDADLGLHLTLTSEWTPFRWGPVLSPSRVPSLIDGSGYLHLTESEAAARIKPAEADAEIRAQVARARAAGITPTHLDAHMGTLEQTPELFAVYLQLAREMKLPARITRQMVADSAFMAAQLGPRDVVIDREIQINPSVPPEKVADWYAEALNSLEPGLTEFVIHLAFDDAEMRAATFDHPDWGAAWRQRDFDFFTSERFALILRERNIQLITWREIGKLLR
jgi:predicted glycoside hydrolase/deacetylase ChbG (UPF0249 family)